MILSNTKMNLKKNRFYLQVTLLLNNAGVVSGRALLDTPDHLIERSFNVNVLSHFWVSLSNYCNSGNDKWLLFIYSRINAEQKTNNETRTVFMRDDAA